MHRATMANEDRKVVALAKSFQTQPALPPPIADTLRANVVTWLDEHLQRLFLIIDDELFKRSDRAESTTAQCLYFDSMRQMRLEAAGLQSSFLARILANFDKFWSAPSQREGGELMQRTAGGGEGTDFALLENEALELELAVTNLAEKGNAKHHREIYALNKRLAYLKSTPEVEVIDNPFSPYSLAHGIAHALLPVELDLQVKLLIFKLFETAIISPIGELYHDLNSLMQEAGILPKLPGGVPKVENSKGEAARETAPAHPIDEPGTQQVTELFESMRSLLNGWRQQMGLPLAAPDFIHSELTYPASDVLGMLDKLQLGSNVAGAAGTEALKGRITEQLQQFMGSNGRLLARPDEDTMDMVAIIFDFILGDRNLPDPVKALIARLQIPVVKVAILEKSFFARKSHPARLLLNALAQAGLGLDPSEAVSENIVFANIEKVVDRILNEFEQNIGLFEELLNEFNKFMDKEVQRSRLTEERTRQVTQSKEQLQLVKRKVAFEIATQLQGQETPAPVRSFLYNVWKDVMILACLRRDKTEGEWERALGVMEKLVWSVTVPVDSSSRKEILQAIPPLLKTIRAGLEAIALDPASVSSTLKDLESCHLERLSQASAGLRTTGVTVGSVSGEAVKEHVVVEIRDPELAQAIREIGAKLPDVEAFTMDELRRSGTDAAFSENPDPESLERAKTLDLGEWVEFQEGRRRLRAKLSWRSPVTATFVFVNRKGVKVMEIGVMDLANRFACGSARIIDGGGVPLMDRALNALMGTLRGSTEKPVPAT